MNNLQLALIRYSSVFPFHLRSDGFNAIETFRRPTFSDNAAASFSRNSRDSLIAASAQYASALVDANASEQRRASRYNSIQFIVSKYRTITSLLLI